MPYDPRDRRAAAEALSESLLRKKRVLAPWVYWVGFALLLAGAFLFWSQMPAERRPAPGELKAKVMDGWESFKNRPKSGFKDRTPETPAMTPAPESPVTTPVVPEEPAAPASGL
jgi:hypothetical protein